MFKRALQQIGTIIRSRNFQPLSKCAPCVLHANANTNPPAALPTTCYLILHWTKKVPLISYFESKVKRVVFQFVYFTLDAFYRVKAVL